MKKIVLLLTLCLVMIAATASAEKFRYKDTGFDFKGYKQADLVDIAVQVIDVPDFVANYLHHETMNFHRNTSQRPH